MKRYIHVNRLHQRDSLTLNVKQESCAIAKMTVRCTVYVSALKKNSGLPDYAHSCFFQKKLRKTITEI